MCITTTLSRWFCFALSAIVSTMLVGSTQYTYRQDSNPANPEVVVYRDPAMEHTNFVANRYFDAADVWDFFKTHPRIGL